MAKTIASLRAVARKYGAEVTDHDTMAWVDAPDGFVWSCSGTYFLALDWTNDPRYRWEAIEDAIERMEYGIRKPGPEYQDPRLEV